MSLSAFATCPPAFEPLLALDLARLGLTGTPEPGGVRFKGELPEIAHANRGLRSASRVLVRLGMPFYARSFEELVERAARLPWGRFLTTSTPIALRVTCHASRLYHSDAVAERILAALTTHFGAEPVQGVFDEDRGGDAQLIVVRLNDDECTVSVDSSGAHLHRRGYRLATAKAPLRETLAAAMLLSSGWDGRAPLVDPFCGSGTIPIEAALLASGRAPNAVRPLPLVRWPCASGIDLRPEIPIETAPPETPFIVASDRNAGAMEAARANAERAGVLRWITFHQHSVSDAAPLPGVGWVVTNPPYGQRLDGPDLRNLYARFGAVLRERFAGWSAAVLAGDAALIRQTRLGLTPRWSGDNGGIAVSLYQGVINPGG